jgi:hypothetical protein
MFYMLYIINVHSINKWKLPTKRIEFRFWKKKIIIFELSRVDNQLVYFFYFCFLLASCISSTSIYWAHHCVRSYVCMYVFMCVCVCVYVCIYICAPMCVCVCLPQSTFLSSCLFLYFFFFEMGFYFLARLILNSLSIPDWPELKFFLPLSSQCWNHRYLHAQCIRVSWHPQY